MREHADVDMSEAPYEPFMDSLRQQLEDQDPVFLIGIVVAVAAIVITCGKKLPPKVALA